MTDSSFAEGSSQPDQESKYPKKRHQEVQSGSQDRPSKQQKLVRDQQLDLSHSVDSTIARMNNAVLSDHLTQRTKRFAPDISDLELADYGVPGIAILPASVSRCIF